MLAQILQTPISITKNKLEFIEESLVDILLKWHTWNYSVHQNEKYLEEKYKM